MAVDCDDIARKVTDAKIYLLIKHPFIGAISSRLEFVETTKVPAATDGKKIYYNPEFFKTLSKGQIVFVIAHEILHVVYDHVFRRGNRNPLVWNMAVDYIVNYTLIKNSIGTAPENILFDERYTDEYTSEELYEKLLKDNVEIATSFDVHLDGPTDSSDSNGQKNVDVEIVGSKITKEDIENIRSEIKSIIFGMYSSMKDAGNIPAGIERLIKKLTEGPKIDWRDVISNFIKSSVKVDYNFKNPSNNSWIYNVIIPTFDKGDEISAHIFIDASGSISDEQLADFLGEIYNIASTFDSFHLTVSSFDTKVYNTKEYTLDNMDDLPNYKIKGGGGTSFECIFDYLKENNIDPKTLIIFTDGYPQNSWGDPNYCNETIFLINNNNERIKAPFGITVRYEN
ncbi:MAG: VWA-like domain-containing protein [Candidatus Woesearchaeota archaeon]